MASISGESEIDSYDSNSTGGSEIDDPDKDELWVEGGSKKHRIVKKKGNDKRHYFAEEPNQENSDKFCQGQFIMEKKYLTGSSLVVPEIWLVFEKKFINFKSIDGKWLYKKDTDKFRYYNKNAKNLYVLAPASLVNKNSRVAEIDKKKLKEIVKDIKEKEKEEKKNLKK